MVECNYNLGRTLIIDLNGPPKNNFRQVDHRTIEWIIYRNVKYTVGKRSTIEELPLKHPNGERNFDASKIKPGNWVCEISYYKVHDKANTDTPIVSVLQDSSNKFGCSKNILSH